MAPLPLRVGVRGGDVRVVGLRMAEPAVGHGDLTVFGLEPVVVAHQALVHRRGGRRAGRDGAGVPRRRVAADAEEAGLDEVPVLDVDTLGCDHVEEVVVDVTLAARLVEHRGQDGLLVVAGDLGDRLLERLHLRREEEERPGLRVAELAVDAVVRPVVIRLDDGLVALAHGTEARTRRRRQADADDHDGHREDDHRDGQAALGKAELHGRAFPALWTMTVARMSVVLVIQVTDSGHGRPIGDTARRRTRRRAAGRWGGT